MPSYLRLALALAPPLALALRLDLALTFVFAVCSSGDMETEQVLFCNGQAADCSTMVVKLIGKTSSPLARCS